LFYSIFKRLHLFLGIPIIIVIMIVVGSLLIPPVYEASTELKVDDTNYEYVGLSDQRLRNSENILRRKEQQINSEIKVARSNEVLKRVVDELDLWKRWTPSTQPEGERRTEAFSMLSDGLTVEPSRDSWVIVITFRSTDREMVAEVANKVAEEYIEQNIKVNTLPEASEFFLERINKEQKELEELQRRFRKLKEGQRVVAYQAQIDQKVKNLSEWESRLTEVEKEILSRRAKIDKINDFLRRNPDILVPIPEIAKVRIVEDLNYRLVSFRLELAALLEKYTEQHREVINLRQQIEDTKTELRSEVRKIIRQEGTELNKLESERDALISSINDLKDEMMGLQEVEAPYKNLERKIANKQDLLQDLNRKFKDSLYAGETDVRLGRVKQISKASTPLTPVFPNLKLNLLIGVPIAILFGLAAVIFLDAFDRTFSNPERVERVLGLPVLATVNYYDKKRQRIFR